MWLFQADFAAWSCFTARAELLNSSTLPELQPSPGLALAPVLGDTGDVAAQGWLFHSCKALDLTILGAKSCGRRPTMGHYANNQQRWQNLCSAWAPRAADPGMFRQYLVHNPQGKREIPGFFWALERGCDEILQLWGDLGWKGP